MELAFICSGYTPVSKMPAISPSTAGGRTARACGRSPPSACRHCAKAVVKGRLFEATRPRYAGLSSSQPDP
jgi:hypothetical protein